MIKNLRRVIRFEFIHTAYWDDQLVGYIVSIPDVNWALKRAKGKWDWLRMLQMPALIKKAKRSRVIALGVDENFRSKGIAMLLIQKLIEKHDEFEEWEFSWVDEANLKSIRAIDGAIPLVKNKVYRLYEKQI
jgi:GNAT superfamily N-acetyltransferase